MIKIAAFIVPQDEIRKKILNLKKKVKKIYGEQPYLSHLPHCTLFTMYASNKILNEKKSIKNIRIKSSSPNYVFVKKTGLFAKDPITSGKTIYFKIKKNTFLSKLQVESLNLFSKFKVNKKIKFKLVWMNKNNKKYGYPFVKKKWIPHFTITSLINVSDKNNFIKNFLRTKIKYKELVKKIYIYKINGNKHKYLWSINITKKK